MLNRKIFLILGFMFSMFMLFGCSNGIEDGYSGGYPNAIEEYTKVDIENSETRAETRNSISNLTGNTTIVQTSLNSTAKPTATIVTNVATTEATMTTTVTETPTEPITTEIVVTEPTEYSIPDDTLVIKESIIPLTYGIPTQDLVDNSDVVCDNGLVSGTNIFIMGHIYKSFDILDSVSVGEKFAINNNGVLKFYEVQRSERAYLNTENTDVFFCSDDSEILYNDYGYPAVILFTCDKQDASCYRWIVIAKEV